MDAIKELLTRRVEQVLPEDKALEKLLRSGKKLKVYQGFDPTGIKLHLGHSIGMRNLQSFVELGHHVIVLFGTGTVLVGDPSQRDTGRKLITEEEIQTNIATWKEQVGKIMDLERVEIKFNGDWLIPMTLKDIIQLGSNISAVQLFKRDSFTKRIERGDTVWFHETLYPLLQGYDSVAMDVDVEIGGTDQTFNMMVGRELQRKINNREKYVLTNPMIMGTDGAQMSKTTGNCIWLDDTAEDMYGKTMSIADEQVPVYMRMLTNLPLEEIESLGKDPLEEKKRLAFEITQQFHGASGAQQAAKHFEATVQNQEIPDDIPELRVSDSTSILGILERAGFGKSNGERKRMIAQGGVELDGNKVSGVDQKISLESPVIIRYGKRNYVKVVSGKK